MRKSNKKINESITESAISPLGYIVFIDAESTIAGSRSSYLKTMFPSETPDVLKNWFRSFVTSTNYEEIKDKLQAISSRFSNNPSLKVLFSSLSKIKSTSYPEEEKESHENDIELIIKRISVYIKRKLTDDDIAVLEQIIEEINSVVNNVSNKIDEEVTSMATPTEEIPEEPSEEEDVTKNEIKVNERVKNKLRKKIKEIIRTHLISNKYR